MNKTTLCVLALLAGCSLPAAAQIDTTLTRQDAFVRANIAVGANKDFTRAQSTASVTTIGSGDVNKRSAKNIANSIIGLGGNGLVSLQNAGTYFSANPTFYVRGLQSLSGSAPLILVDGIERDMDIVDPTEVDHVDILKDAAAVALYGNSHHQTGKIQHTSHPRDLRPPLQLPDQPAEVHQRPHIRLCHERGTGQRGECSEVLCQ